MGIQVKDSRTKIFWVRVVCKFSSSWSECIAIWRSLFKAPSALPPPLFAYIPLVIVLITLPKDFSSRAAWSCKFCLVNSRSSCPI